MDSSWIKRSAVVAVLAITLVGCTSMEPTDEDRIAGEWVATLYEVTIHSNTYNVLDDALGRKVVVEAKFADGVYSFSCTPSCIKGIRMRHLARIAKLYDKWSGTYTLDQERKYFRYEITAATGPSASGVGLVGYWHYLLPTDDTLHFDQVVVMPPTDQTDGAVHILKLKRKGS